MSGTQHVRHVRNSRGSRESLTQLTVVFGLRSKLLDDLGIVDRLESLVLPASSARVQEVCLGLLANLADDDGVAASVVRSRRLVRGMAEVTSGLLFLVALLLADV